MSIKIKFCGAAHTVTGSCMWIQTPKSNFLIDCGMFQGSKSLKELNYTDFPFDPAKLDFVLLTHAHIDHSGQLPRLYRHGFKGPILTTSGSRDLLTYMLPDSGYIQEMEVEYLNRRLRQRGKPEVSPIYTKEDGESVLKIIRAVPYEHWQKPGLDVRARFWNAGHILGAASIELEIDQEGKDAPLRVLASGDIGPEHKLFHPDPTSPDNLDFVICESTYGGRDRNDLPPEERRNALAAEVNMALAQDGILLIPAFAVERTQELLADLALLLSEDRIPKIPVFLDSPLAIRATEVFSRHASSLEDVNGWTDIFQNPAFHYTETVDQSRSIARYTGGVIVISASGMCEAGRIRHHLKHYLWRKNATVMLVGYQAPGTLGRMLEDGKKTVRIQGEDIQVRARIRSVDWYSGHADGEDLVRWIKAREPIKQGLFLVHGEQDGLYALRDAASQNGIDAKKIATPELDDEFDLTAAKPLKADKAPTPRITTDRVFTPDWHNRLAEDSIVLRDLLDSAPSNKAREKLLERIEKILNAEWSDRR